MTLKWSSNTSYLSLPTGTKFPITSEEADAGCAVLVRFKFGSVNITADRYVLGTNDLTGSDRGEYIWCDYTSGTYGRNTFSVSNSFFVLGDRTQWLASPNRTYCAISSSSHEQKVAHIQRATSNDSWLTHRNYEAEWTTGNGGVTENLKLSTDSISDFRIGRRPSVGGMNLQSGDQIAEVAYWNRPLTGQEFGAMMYEGYSADNFPEGLTCYWPFMHLGDYTDRVGGRVLQENGTALSQGDDVPLIRPSPTAFLFVPAGAVGGSTYDKSMSLAATASMTPTNDAALLGSATLSATHSVTPTNDAALLGSATLSATHSVTPTTVAVFLSDITLSANHGLTPAAGIELESAITLAVTQTLANSSIITKESGISLGVSSGLSYISQHSAGVALSLDLTATLAPDNAGSLYGASMSLGLTGSLTLSGGTDFEGAITLPVSATYVTASALSDTLAGTISHGTTFGIVASGTLLWDEQTEQTDIWIEQSENTDTWGDT